MGYIHRLGMFTIYIELKRSALCEVVRLQGVIRCDPYAASPRSGAALPESSLSPT
jgi:hypothetical protein